MIDFEVALTGGHPNSLGRTLEVVDVVQSDLTHIERLYDCFKSTDPVVRLRTSNAFKRLVRANPMLFENYAHKLVREVGAIPQDSTSWTVAQIIGENLKQWRELSQDIQDESIQFLFGLFTRSNDWIVLNAALKTLANIAVYDGTVDARFRPIAEEYLNDPRKSVSNTARKAIVAIDSGGPIK